MGTYSLYHTAVFLTLLTLLQRTNPSAHDGLIPNGHDRYFVEDLQLREELSSVRGPSIGIGDLNAKLSLKFQPEILDFQQRPLGVPHLERVTLFNVDRNRSIDMTSISGSTVHFHSSFFEDKKIPPLGNTSFNVVFLGREEGAIESNLFIHTTEGHFKYQVKGASVSSPYRLRPIVGIKLPPNSTFSPLIYMHNPHPDPIQILEIYSSGGDFHLELPSGELEGPKNMWEIPSLQTKAVIRIRFNARAEQNHTAYVRIKLNNTEEILVVPLEVEVTASAGLYLPQGSLDFGIGGSKDPPKKIDLVLQNPLKKSVRIHSVTSTSKAISISFDNVKVPADTKGGSTAKVATLTLDWKQAFEHKEFSGKIVIKYKNGKSSVEIPFFATVLDGGLVYNASATTYFINELPKQLTSRDIMLNNTFSTPLAVLEVSLPAEAEEFFNVLHFKPITLQPGESAKVFTLNFNSKANLMDLKLNSYIRLKTNVSAIEIPLLSYNGKLRAHFPYKSKDNALDLGLVSLNIQKYTYFVVLNTNPIPVGINQLTTSLPGSSADIVYCGTGNYTIALLQDFSKNSSTCITLKPDEFAIVGLSIKSPQAEGQVWGDVVVQTDFERLSIPVHYKVALGKLEIGPDRLVFDKCFPGKICSHPIRVHSTFNDPMVIENIVSIPPDPRLKSKHLGHIMARSTKVIGHLYIDPSVTCEDNCYTGLNFEQTIHWLNTLSLPQMVADIDLNLVNSLYLRYLNTTSNGLKKWENLTIRLDTSEIKGHIFKTRVKMSWPTLVSVEGGGNNSLVKFPLSQLGNTSYQNVTIKNPSSHNLLVQLVLHKAYPNYEVLNDGLPSPFILEDKPSTPRRSKLFFLKATSYRYPHNLGVTPHRDTLTMMLGPGENFTVTIGFKADEVVPATGYLYVRNNLTVVEVIQFKGHGAVPSFKFGNRKPGSVQPLSFELSEKHLRDCERKKSGFPNLTVKRTFTARNLGDIGIFINGFSINGMPCEGYGFRVLNCEPFLLAPNATRKIDIAFTPDFTLAKVTRTLILESSLNFPVNYTLVTTLPPSLLMSCSNALIRPFWEGHLYYVAVCLMAVLLVFVIAMVIVEAEHTLKEAASAISRGTNTIVPPPLDLRLIGAQARTEVRSQKDDKVEEEKPDKRDEVKSTNTQGTNTVPTDTNRNELEKSKTEPDSRSPKTETEKYTVLIPATGKSKKKLNKKNSNEFVDEPRKKMCENAKHKSKHGEKLNVEQNKKSNHEAKETKKVHCTKKQNKVAEVQPVQVLEEEASSTSTESSNNEENDKENAKVMEKRATSVRNELHVIEIRSNQPTDANASEAKKTEKRILRRNPNKSKDQDIFDKSQNKINVESKSKLSRNKKEYKEKSLLGKKLSSDKTPLKYSNEKLNRNSPVTSTSVTVWSENKAKFSDVVARNETTPTVTPATSPVPIYVPNSTPSIVPTVCNPSKRPSIKLVQSQTCKQTQTSKPTMYVEPYKQTSVDLGPIGSRKIDHQQENHNFDLQNHYHNQISNNSFFSDNHNLPMDNNSTSYVNFPETWEHQNQTPLGNLMQSNHNHLCSVANTQDAWDFQSNTNCTGFWDPIPTGTAVNASHTAMTSQDSSYLWGSSSVWQPWTPVDYSRARTPPGFQNSHETEENTQANPAYDIFGMNIWSQQQTKPWSYPPGQ